MSTDAEANDRSCDELGQLVAQAQGALDDSAVLIAKLMDALADRVAATHTLAAITAEVLRHIEESIRA